MAPALALLLAAAEPSPAVEPERCTVADASFSARLDGTLARKIHWNGADMSCSGMRRPAGGLRLSFAGSAGDAKLVFVFGVPELAEGATGKALAVNVTIIHEGGGLYSTQGKERCTLDSLVQSPLERSGPIRRWRVEGRGFCLEPARALGAGTPEGAILLATFDFVGLLTWEEDPAA
jgi:hypothetical protein